MAKNLVIVESPAKAKTIEKFLGKDFKVQSSFGHIADLPSKELGVDVDGDFTPKSHVGKVVSVCRACSKCTFYHYSLWKLKRQSFHGV